MPENTNTGRVFTESEHAALVNDAVQRETASAVGRATAAETATAELTTKLDTLETEKAAAEQRATAAEKALEDFKADIAEKAAVEARKDDRKTKLAEANPLLELSDERVARIAAMSDEGFESYLADMREVASKAGAKAPAKADEGVQPPRATAAFGGGDGDGSKPKASVVGVIGARRGLTAQTQTA